MSAPAQVSDVPGTAQAVDVDALSRRTDAVERFVDSASGRVPEDRLAAARALVERAGQRLRLSREHTVVALAGATGSGKSSLFNALAGLELSPVGRRRPTTAAALACVWNPAGAADLLDWLGIAPDHQVARESVLDGDQEAALHGLVLLDLPDFDSIEEAHRGEVDRLLGLADLVVWVLDPQKYADRVVHDRYLRRLHRHREVTVVVLNQIDTLADADVDRCAHDLRRLLAADGLAGVPLLLTSATGPAGLPELHDLVERTVARRQAAIDRLWADVDDVTADLADLVGPEVAEDAIDRNTVRALTDALADASGVRTVAAAAGRAYQRLAMRDTGWPLVRWARRLGRRAGAEAPAGDAAGPAVSAGDDAGPAAPADGTAEVPLTADPPGDPSPETEDAPGAPLPAPTRVAQARLDLTLRGVAERSGAGLPGPWPDALVRAARVRTLDLTDALDAEVAATGVDVDRRRVWWRAVAVLHWLLVAAALAGAVWLVLRLAGGAAGSDLRTPVGQVPVPLALLLGGLAAGVLLAAVAAPLVALGARRARTRAEARLRFAVTELAREYVVAPLRTELSAYADARAALAVALP